MATGAVASQFPVTVVNLVPFGFEQEQDHEYEYEVGTWGSALRISLAGQGAAP